MTKAMTLFVTILKPFKSDFRQQWVKIDGVQLDDVKKDDVKKDSIVNRSA